ncbi:MAG: ABC transporter ATP-binding protein [Rhodobacteraceae bacterium]|nr:ABC transporter ATP-binding protein [Paracoccaceae bacterium]
MSGVSLERIDKRFGSFRVLQDIDLSIKPGEFVSFVGPSGSGKSTLLRIIAGLEAPTSGQIRIGGADVTRAEPVDRGVAMVFQNYALYPHMSVYENIAFPLRTLKTSRGKIDAKVHETAKILRLEDRLSHKPAALSGGQRQRVAIGRAIVRDPDVFLFDEPLSNLDASLRSEMRLEIGDLHARLESTMIYVTHDQVEAMTMSDRIAVLNGGRIEQFDAPMALYHRPCSRFVADFIGHPAMNMLPARLSAAGEDRIDLNCEGLDLIIPVQAPDSARVGDDLTLGIRPEHVTPARDGVAARVRMIEQLGANTIAHCDTLMGNRLTASIQGDFAAERGSKIWLHFDPVHGHAFSRDGIAFRRTAI